VSAYFTRGSMSCSSARSDMSMPSRKCSSAAAGERGARRFIVQQRIDGAYHVRGIERGRNRNLVPHTVLDAADLIPAMGTATHAFAQAMPCISVERRWPK